MTICFIADLRSSIARSWIGYFAGRHDVHVLSTFPAPPLDGVATHLLAAGRQEDRWQKRKADWSRFLDPVSWPGRLVSAAHDQFLQPLKVRWLADRAAGLVEHIQPDLVHSLRIPIEGEIGGRAVRSRHVISAWGNDFTLYAEKSFLHRAETRRALRGCAGFLADAQADVERAELLGLPRSVPRLVVPGAGGIRSAIFPGIRAKDIWTRNLAPLADLPADAPLVVNPRGFRRYVRNDSFFEAARLVALGHRRVCFVGVGMKGWKPIEQLVEKTGLGERVILTPALTQNELAALYARAAVSVSPTEHDGTPNSLLESMACGCFPVCGDLPSIREWIQDGVNGLLVRADRPLHLAAAIRRALADGELRRTALAINAGLVKARAGYHQSMARAEAFYAALLEAPVSAPVLQPSLSEVSQ